MCYEHDDDLQAQHAVDDAKYETPEQDEPPEGYYDERAYGDDDEAAEAARMVAAGPIAPDPCETPGDQYPWGPAYSNEPPF